MIYAVESEVRKYGLATVVLYSENEDKKNPICKKNQEHEESFLDWVSGGMCFQYNGQNLYIVSGRAYQIVAALKTHCFECKESQSVTVFGATAGVHYLLETKPQVIYFNVRDIQRYDPLEVLNWNIAQFEAFRKAHPRTREACVVSRKGEEFRNVHEIEDLFSERKEKFLSAKVRENIALEDCEIYGLTFTTKKGR